MSVNNAAFAAGIGFDRDDGDDNDQGGDGGEGGEEQ